MKPSPHSLRSKLLTVILLCWVVPVMVLIGLTVLFVGREYRRTAKSILETDAAGALRQTELLFSQAFNASKEVTYDGVILSAYRAYQDSKDASSLYRTATDYLAQKYSRDESLSGVYIGFWEESSIVPYASAKGSVNGRLSSSFPREVRQELMDAMADADTYIRVLSCNGQLYIAEDNKCGNIQLIVNRELFKISLKPRYFHSIIFAHFSYPLSQPGGQARFLLANKWK